MKQKYYLVLNNQERRFVIESLNQLRNKLIVDGKYTDAVDCKQPLSAASRAAFPGQSRPY